MQIVESVESTPDLKAREERRCSGREALVGHGLDMEDLASMCERQCRKACNLRSAAEELEETGSNGRARRYRKRGSRKNPRRKPGRWRRIPARSGCGQLQIPRGIPMAIRPLSLQSRRRGPDRPQGRERPFECSLEHDAEALERPTKARRAPVARHTEPKRDNMGDTPMAEESEAPGTVRCAGETRPGGQEQRSQWHGQQHCLAQKT